MKLLKIAVVSLVAGLWTASLGIAAPPQTRVLLIDFGNNSSWRGVSVPFPDSKGHYWTSVYSGAFYADMIDMNGVATAVDFGFTTAGGTDSYNGPAGATASGADYVNTSIDTNALGNLGVKEAAFDYYTSSSFQIQGLDPTYTYNLTFYGSHKYSTDSATVYSIYTDNTFTTRVASTNLNVCNPAQNWLHNSNTVATIRGLVPQTGNILYVKYVGSGGSDGYLNAMQIEAVPPPFTTGLYILQK
jgi:hypothetical protein